MITRKTGYTYAAPTKCRPYNLDINLALLELIYSSYVFPDYTFPFHYVDCFFFFWLRRTACRILVPRWNPRPLQWKHGVLTTGPPGKSLYGFLKRFKIAINGCLTSKLIISAALTQRSMKVEMGKRVKTWETPGLQRRTLLYENRSTHTAVSENATQWENDISSKSEKSTFYKQWSLYVLLIYGA